MGLWMPQEQVMRLFSTPVSLEMHYQTFFFEKVIPTAGCLICFLMFVSPLERILMARREGTLGDLNPLTFPVMMANCAGWVAYSFVQQDVFVFAANEPGLLLSIFLTVSAYKLSNNEKVQSQMLTILLFFTATLTILGFVTATGYIHKDSQSFAWGVTTNIILLIFYGTPLLSVVEVIRSRCSGPLIWQMSMMSLINSILWVVYGLHLHLPFMWVPNAIGAVLANLQLTLCLAYPKCRAAVVNVDGLTAPLLVQGTIGDVEDAITALGKVGIASQQHVINIHASGEHPMAH